MTLVFGPSLSRVESDILETRLKPKHGPGATSDRLYGNQKWQFRTWHERLEYYFPFLEYGIPNHRYIHELSSPVILLDPTEETPTKLVAVPKTATKPRLIAEEPTCMQYVQQGIKDSLVGHLESGHTSRWLVGFSDQVPNQDMARIGSMDKSLATLDLSDASDSVANWLVEDLFANFGVFLEAIQACRSTTCRLPSGEVISLQKFASMGSALTFPLEAIVFSSIVLTAVLECRGQAPSQRAINRFEGQVRVYGDDIIVPTDCAETVIDWLETFGFSVNRDKSFWTGEFRESCGKEYWRGYDVSVVKFRKPLPSSRHNADEVISTVKTRNLLAKAGCNSVVSLLDDLLEKVLGHFPWVLEESPILGRVHPSGFYQVDKMCPQLHVPLVKGWKARSVIPVNRVDGGSALLKCLIVSIGNPDTQGDHLERSGRPRVVSIKLSNGTPY